jgi:hypothetical protein
MKIERYSPGGYGAMCKDELGDYLRLSDLSQDSEELREARAHIALLEEEAVELKKRLHDMALAIVRFELGGWKSTSKLPAKDGEYLVCYRDNGEAWTQVIKFSTAFNSMGTMAVAWREIDPLPGSDETPWDTMTR